jgi:hypothetical protein
MKYHANKNWISNNMPRHQRLDVYENILGPIQ